MHSRYGPGLHLRHWRGEKRRRSGCRGQSKNDPQSRRIILDQQFAIVKTRHSRGKRETGVTLQTDDIDASYAHLKKSGVDVDAEIMRMGDPVPPMFWFRDPEGNTLLVVQ